MLQVEFIQKSNCFDREASFLHRTIVFDAVGTLIHPIRDVAQIYHEAGRRHGFLLSVKELQHRFKLARPRHFSNVGEEADEPTSENDQKRRWKCLIAEVFRERSDIHDLFEDLWLKFSAPDCWSLYSDVVATIDGLEDAGHTIAIASNFDSRLNSILLGFPQLGMVSRVFTSAEIGFAKPSTLFFDQVQSLLETSPSHLVMVGDDAVCDFDGSGKAGWKQVLIARGSQTPQRKPFVRQLTDLPAALYRL